MDGRECLIEREREEEEREKSLWDVCMREEGGRAEDSGRGGGGRGDCVYVCVFLRCGRDVKEAGKVGLREGKEGRVRKKKSKRSG